MMSLDRNHTAETLDRLAALVASVRVGCAWDVAGIKAGLVAAANRRNVTIAQLAAAAIIVAEDPQALTPQRIAHDGPWWGKAAGEHNTTSAMRVFNPATACAICTYEADDHHHPHLADHEYVHPSTHTPRRTA